MTCIAYFDCFSGVAGDMILGALVDAGLALEALREALEPLSLDGYALEARRVRKGPLAGTKVDVVIDRKDPPFRDAGALIACVRDSGLADDVKERSVRIFERLGRAEAVVHGVSADEVHFHDLALVDTAVDVVGAVAGLRILGVSVVQASPISVGRGFLTCGHGRLPVPPPASVEILKGIPTIEIPVEGEIATPTGCAILAELAQAFGPRPPMVYDRVGYGAGEKDLPGAPNLLRLFLGRPGAPEEADRAVVLETNLDDLPGQVLGPLYRTLLEAGALDVWVVPVTMKKGRPGNLLSVLTPVEAVGAIESILFRETTSLGIRRHEVLRSKLQRRVERVETGYGPVRIKVGILPDGAEKGAPEFDDCLALSQKCGVPVREVLEAARSAWRAKS
ncbi:MAG: nickel pincer cofactor biosynthesis protein LarC [Planctomycetota bacterium]|jgi:uncharacterized protein (TIGR00299 family) protein